MTKLDDRAGEHDASSRRERLVVAIDGPSGTGKSTVSRRVAAALGLRYLDTGAMYRAIAVAGMRAGVDLDDQPAVMALAQRVHLDISLAPDIALVQVDGQDVTSEIREPAVSAQVSAVARNLGVRAVLVARQQALVAEAPLGIVLEGRDTTTVVAPDAAVRILLTAADDVRLARRAAEVHGAVDSASLAATHQTVLGRDAADSTVVNFHEPAPGVVLLDTTGLDLEASVSAALDIVMSAAGDRLSEEATADRQTVGSR